MKTSERRRANQRKNYALRMSARAVSCVSPGCREPREDGSRWCARCRALRASWDLTPEHRTAVAL